MQGPDFALLPNVMRRRSNRAARVPRAAACSWTIALIVAGYDPSGAPAAATALADHRPPYLAARYTRLQRSPAATAGGPASLEATDQQLAIGLARMRFAAVTLDVGLDYQYSRYEYTGIDSRNRDQHRLQVPLRLRAGEGNPDFEAWLTPGVSTSSNVFQQPLERWSSNDLTLAAGAEWQWPAARELRFIAGVARDRALGRAATYPIAGVHFLPGENLSLRLAFPNSEVRYEPGGSHGLMLRLYPAGHEWHVVSDTLQRDFDYGMRAVRAEGTWSYRPWKRVAIDLTLGYETRRRHRFIDDLGTRIEAHGDDEWLASIGLRIGAAPLPYAHGQR